MPVTIREVYRQFNPLKPLEAGDPRYVECRHERGLPSLFHSLRLPLEDEPRPFLFSGHLGDGKTTILKQLQGQLEQEEGDFVAFGEADDRLDLSDVEYDDVLLAILAVVDQSLRDRFQADMETPPFQRVWQELFRIANLPVELREAELSLGPFGKLAATVKDSPDARLQVRQRLREARGATFLDVVNEYLHKAQDVVRQHDHRQLVVILDNLDRLPETQVAASGGHMRELMTLMRQACTEALAVHSDLPLTAADISTAISQLGAQRRMVAADYREAQRSVSETHRLDKVPTEVRQALLRHRLVYEYFSDGNYWYDIAPLLREEQSGNG